MTSEQWKQTLEKLLHVGKVGVKALFKAPNVACGPEAAGHRVTELCSARPSS